ncbi:hypothetical protein JHFBIEKO_3072 [Methylobacterium mesophilicum]|uniref:hypothetical protein n=1 Tax=Methylobacterium mesophilicum TaxID=39956 RepID=UPI001EE24137|nr:hypothetical protein [Methylobacterium mesophilicum]GJE22616.1 hypothetical protein JHFBIEKO_3072 [Methylobacterium mesophilicum]
MADRPRPASADTRNLRDVVWGFEKDYYLKEYPDVAIGGFDPIEHYFEIGWKEGRDPSDYFSTAGYLAANPDVAAAEINPLRHFLDSGHAEGRAGWRKQHAEERSAPEIIWGFDRKYYLRNNPDIAIGGFDPVEHYFEIGWKEGRDPSDYFSTSGYLATNADVAAAEINPLRHFLDSGHAEGRAGWRKKQIEEWCTLAATELHALRDRIGAIQRRVVAGRFDEADLEPFDLGASIPLTSRAKGIFVRIAGIAHSQSLG